MSKSEVTKEEWERRWEEEQESVFGLWPQYAYDRGMRIGEMYAASEACKDPEAWLEGVRAYRNGEPSSGLHPAQLTGWRQAKDAERFEGGDW